MAKDVQIPAFIQDLRARLGIPGALALRLDETISPVIVLDLPGERLVQNLTVKPCWAFARVSGVAGLTSRSSVNFPNGSTFIAHVTRCLLTAPTAGLWQFFLQGNVLTTGVQTLFRDERLSPGGVPLPRLRASGDTDVGAVTVEFMQVRNTELTVDVPMDLWLTPDLDNVPMWIFNVVNTEIAVTWFWDEFDERVSVTP